MLKPSRTDNVSAVDNSKWYKVKKLKHDVAALFALMKEEPDFTTRESVYDQHREELQVQIRYLVHI